MTESDGNLFSMLPQIGKVMARSSFVRLEQTYSRPLVIGQLRKTLDQLRRQVAEGLHTEASLTAELDRLDGKVAAHLQHASRGSLRSVINATGVILQTNLGRAPLSEAAIAHISATARGYCNLEFDVEAGVRSHRDVHVQQLILNVLSSRAGLPQEALQGKAAAVVNNCAAACFLALNSLAEGGEVIVSRGELVEIGGGFRVPEILRKSGAVLREVGTTNRTRIADYAAAINPSTRLILRVHQSNFRIDGFTERPTLDELRELGRQASVPVFEDQGTGCVVALTNYGIERESSLVQSVRSGIDLVACSGDKLLGGPQCGVLVGSETCISRIRANPLFRVMRADKLSYAALQATLLAYLGGVEDRLPALAMMRTSANEIRNRCVAIASALSSSDLIVEVVETQSVIGGGTTPGASLPSFAIALQHRSVSEAKLAALLRRLDPPVIARAQEGRVLLDLRTVFPREDEALTTSLLDALESIRIGSAQNGTA